VRELAVGEARHSPACGHQLGVALVVVLAGAERRMVRRRRRSSPERVRASRWTVTSAPVTAARCATTPGARRRGPGRTVTWTEGSGGTEDIAQRRAAETWLGTALSPHASTAAPHAVVDARGRHAEVAHLRARRHAMLTVHLAV
jgi:hypothetical protein